jgi:hypothetical protein
MKEEQVVPQRNQHPRQYIRPSFSLETGGPFRRGYDQHWTDGLDCRPEKALQE